MSESEAVKIGENLLSAGKHKELIQLCKKYVDQYKNNPKLWKLLGVAHGVSGNAKGARLSFLSALELDPKDALSLANYVTSCFDVGDKSSALGAIELFFKELDLEGQKIILESLLEFIKSGQVTTKELPNVIQELLNSDTNS